MTCNRTRTRIRTFSVLVAAIAAASILNGCKKESPTASFAGAMQTVAAWPHTGSGASARLLRPLVVRIAQYGGQPARRRSVVDACADWQQATDGRITFAVLPDADNATAADITVNVEATSDQVGGPQFPGESSGGGESAYGKTSWTEQNGVMTHADVYVSGFLSTDNLRGVVRHEIGHAIGILGHSPDSRDPMYPRGLHNMGITPADLATLAGIYALR